MSNTVVLGGHGTAPDGTPKASNGMVLSWNKEAYVACEYRLKCSKFMLSSSFKLVSAPQVFCARYAKFLQVASAVPVCIFFNLVMSLLPSLITAPLTSFPQDTPFKVVRDTFAPKSLFVRS